MTDQKTNSCSATLDMVCPPISNSAAARLTGHSGAEAVIRKSDFYMICARAEAKFKDFRFDDSAGQLHFAIEVPGVGRDTGWINMGELPDIKESAEDCDARLSLGANHLRISIFTQESAERPIAGFTPDEVLFWRGRKSSIVGGFDGHLDLATYDLLYVGIAKVGDSYDRLFAKGHYARMQILANEPQRHPGARVSDEIFLFLFKVEPLFVRIFGPGSTIEDDDLDFSYEAKRLVADAEKAFVHLLRPAYNNTLYANYPRGKDGLYASGLTAYTYSISEGVALLTKFGRIKGGREREFTMSNEADFIMVKGNDVTFHIAGENFLAD